MGAKKIIAAVVHPVFSGKVIANLNNSPIDELIITDTIPLAGKEKDCNKKISLLSVSNLFAQAIRRIHNGDSVGDLFWKFSKEEPPPFF